MSQAKRQFLTIRAILLPISTYLFSADVSSESLIVDIRRLKTIPFNIQIVRGCLRRNCLSDHSSRFATHFDICLFRGCLERELHFQHKTASSQPFQHQVFPRMSQAKCRFLNIRAFSWPTPTSQFSEDVSSESLLLNIRRLLTIPFNIRFVRGRLERNGVSL